MSDEQPPTDGGRPNPTARTCGHCGSRNLLRGLQLGVQNSLGVGLKYRASGQFMGLALLGIEPLFATVCGECGTLVRVYVKCPDRDWV